MINYYFAEKNSPSDEELIILDLFFSDGESIEQGKVAIELEGAKAIFEIETINSGFIYYFVAVGDRVPIGSPLFAITKVVCDEPLNLRKSTDFQVTDSSKVNLEKFSVKALNIMRLNNLAEEEFREFDFVTEEDVREYLNKFNQGIVYDISNFEKICLVGGGRGAEVLLSRFKKFELESRIVGYIDDHPSNSQLYDIDCLGSLDFATILSLFNQRKIDSIMITITSSMELRKTILSLAQDNSIPLASYTDPGAFVSSDVTISQGCIVLDGVRLGFKAFLDANVFLSGLVNIDHHSRVGENTTFGPGVFLSGGVRIGNNCVLGSSIAIEPGIVIGDDCMIASGSVITSNIKSNTVLKTVTQNITRRRN